MLPNPAAACAALFTPAAVHAVTHTPTWPPQNLKQRLAVILMVAFGEGLWKRGRVEARKIEAAEAAAGRWALPVLDARRGGGRSRALLHAPAWQSALMAWELRLLVHTPPSPQRPCCLQRERMHLGTAAAHVALIPLLLLLIFFF